MASILLITIYIIATAAIAAAGVLFLEIPGLPQVLQDLLLFGKSRGKRKQWTFVRLLEVPKRYVLGSGVSGPDKPQGD